MVGKKSEGRARVRATNLQNQGLISVDRSNKATLLLTIPRSTFKSSARDSSLPIFEIAITVVDDTGPKPIRMRVTLEEVKIVAFQHGF